MGCGGVKDACISFLAGKMQHMGFLLVQGAKRLEVEGFAPFFPIDIATLQISSNSAAQSLFHFVRQEMNGDRLYVVHIFGSFLTTLTNISGEENYNLQDREVVMLC